jgi:hypothetical protein
MITPDLPLPTTGYRRISFAYASSLLVAQALTEAHERLKHHFPTLRWATWDDVLRQLQPDVLVTGKAVRFDWHALARRVHRLAASPGCPTPDQPASTEEAEEPVAYQQQAIRALAELRENPLARTPLAQALLTKLAQGHAVPPRGGDAAPEPHPLPPNTACVPALESSVPLPGPAEGTVDSRDDKWEGPGGAPPVPTTGQQPTPDPAPRRNAVRRRTFRDIVQKHPRGNGTFGFRVRELCAMMRTSAASLTEARKNPGRLSVNMVVALAEAMGEDPLRVLTDLLAEAGAKRENGKRGRKGRRPAP